MWDFKFENAVIELVWTQSLTCMKFKKQKKQNPSPFLLYGCMNMWWYCINLNFLIPLNQCLYQSSCSAFRHVAPSWACCCGVLSWARPRGLKMRLVSSYLPKMYFYTMLLYTVARPAVWLCPSVLLHNHQVEKKQPKQCSSCQMCASWLHSLCVCVCVFEWHDKAGIDPFLGPIKAEAPQQTWLIGHTSLLSQRAVK